MSHGVSGLLDSAHDVAALTELDANARLTASAIQSKLLPLLATVTQERKDREKYLQKEKIPLNVCVDQFADVDMNQRDRLVSAFSTVNGHLDSFYNTILPEYAINMVVPNNVPRPNSIPVPVVLSTLVGPEDSKDYEYHRDEAYEIGAAANLAEDIELSNALRAHATAVDGIVEGVSGTIEKWRKQLTTHRREREREERKRKFSQIL